MKIEKVRKGSFAVIGKEGSTSDGDGFIQKLWEDANLHFNQISHLTKKDENGNLAGVWGAMSDFTHSFMPWEDFKSGLYLAGAECIDEAQAPDGWVKWVIPGYEYLRVENDERILFRRCCGTWRITVFHLLAQFMTSHARKLEKTICSFRSKKFNHLWPL